MGALQHAFPVVPTDDNTSLSSKGIGLRRDSAGGLPWVVMVHTAKRPRRPEAVGFPGGSQNPFETPKETLLREYKGETGIAVSSETFPETWRRSSDPVPSGERPGYLFHQQFWYIGFLADNLPRGEITEKTEVIERVIFRLDKIPFPDPEKERVPALFSHIKKLELMLMHVEHEVEEASVWLEVVQKRFRPYLRR